MFMYIILLSIFILSIRINPSLVHSMGESRYAAFGLAILTAKETRLHISCANLLPFLYVMTLKALLYQFSMKFYQVILFSYFN